MYAGQVVEQSRGTTLVDEPTHPYTQLLIASVPDPSDTAKEAPPTGEHAQTAIAEKGCRFSPRCPHVMDRCREEEPPAFVVGEDHTSKCWLYAGHDAAVEVALPTRRKEGRSRRHEPLRIESRENSILGRFSGRQYREGPTGLALVK